MEETNVSGGRGDKGSYPSAHLVDEMIRDPGRPRGRIEQDTENHRGCSKRTVSKAWSSPHTPARAGADVVKNPGAKRQGASHPSAAAGVPPDYGGRGNENLATPRQLGIKVR